MEFRTSGDQVPWPGQGFARLLRRTAQLPKRPLGSGEPEEMKVTNICRRRLWGPRHHDVGGALATIAAAQVAAASRNFLGLEYHCIETPWVGEFVVRDLPLFKDSNVV